ncbi:hypothetical protein V2I01_21615 [Micromonospora sp. BRA006-A]|nr:hypothetical protein [Micromonospora sp. BRA006-A]
MTWPDGSAAAVDQIGRYGYRVLVRLAETRAGKVRGLLGDFDGDPADDIAPASGRHWPSRCRSTSSIPRTRTAGGSPGTARCCTTTTGRTPAPSPTARSRNGRSPSPTSTRPRRAAAEQVCRWAGVTAPAQLAECVFDVAVSGRPEFAVAGASTERVAPPAATPITAVPVATATLTPGGEPRRSPPAPGTPSSSTPPRRASGTAARRTCSPNRADGRSPAAATSRATGTSTASTSPPPARCALRVTAAPGDTGRAAVRVYAARDSDGTLQAERPGGHRDSRATRRAGALPVQRARG